MRRIFLLSVLSFLAYMSVNAQSPSLSGSVKDTTANAMVKNAVVAFLSPGDSILKAFTRTSADGKFEVPALKPGKYILMVMHPVFADLVDDVTIGPDTRVLTTVFLTPKSKLLQEVIVKSGAPIKIKGDTTIYTADSFKVSANANVEELLKKLPGIQVDRNGEIKAMGETVEKVLVDGEEFFGDDPGMAVKNLRADAVKEVQVFDKKSEQAEFTGIDDGKTQKTINLKLKEDKKRGYFGKISAAGGLLKNADPRFNNNLMFGSFKGKRKLSAFVLNGNTGQDGMNWQDMQKYGGSDDMNMEFDDESGGMYFWRGGTSADDEPNINTENGFITNVNAGLQYTNKWNDKQTLNFSPKFNSQDYSNITDNFTQTLLGDSILNENANTRTAVLRTNLKTSAIYDVKVDSMNSIKFTVKANAYHTESEETRLSETSGKFGNIKNSSDRLLSLNSDKLALTANIVYKHKFRKNRRTLSINTDWNLLNTDSRNTQQSANRTFETGIPELELINQQTNGEKQTQKVGIKVVYTEPLSKKWALEIGHELSYNFGNNNQTTYAYSNTSGKYDQLVDSLTNDFKQHIMLNKPSVKFSYNHKKLKFNLGSGFGITNFDLTDRTNNKEYVRNFVNFFPTANVNYSYKSNHSLRLSYSGSTSQPTINQLQPLRNNNNQFNQYIGNPDLKPSFANNFSVTHNGYDFKKDRWMFQSLNVTLTSNSITNNRVIDPGTGKTITQPINTNGNWNINFWSGVGFKLKKSNIRLNVSPNVNYFRFADVINNKKSFANTLNAGISVYASKSKDKKYDFTIGNDFNENYNKNAQTNSSSTFFTNTLHAYATVYHKKVWSLITEYHFNAREKTVGSTSNLNNHMLNAQLQRTFKNNEFTAFVSVKDILNQNIGIDRNFYSNTYTEERNLRLKRYFLVGFTWDFKNKNKTNTEKK